MKKINKQYLKDCVTMKNIKYCNKCKQSLHKMLIYKVLCLFITQINKYIKISLIIFLHLKRFSFLHSLAKTGNDEHMPIMNKFLQKNYLNNIMYNLKNIINLYN